MRSTFRASVWFIAWQGLPGDVSFFRVCVFDAGFRFGWIAPSLFDNCIGRKRNVDGGFLATCPFEDGYGAEALREMSTDGHVSRFIAFRFRPGRMCLGLVEISGLSGSGDEL